MDEKTNGFSAVDKFFLVLTASGFLGGITFTCLLPTFPFAILPSILFGSGISSMVYRFMGGIKPDDSISIGNVAKLSGTLGSLIASIFILNTMFEKQVPPWSLSSKPDKSDVIVLRNDAEPTDIDLVAKALERDLRHFKIDKPTRNLANNFQANCWQGKGICKAEAKEAIIKKDDSIPQGKARLCLNNGTLLGLPLLITNSNSRAIRVDVIGLEQCQDKSNQRLEVMIGQEDAKSILGKKTVENGQAAIAPLQNFPIDPTKEQVLVARKNSL